MRSEHNKRRRRHLAIKRRQRGLHIESLEDRRVLAVSADLPLSASAESFAAAGGGTASEVTGFEPIRDAFAPIPLEHLLARVNRQNYATGELVVAVDRSLVPDSTPDLASNAATGVVNTAESIDWATRIGDSSVSSEKLLFQYRHGERDVDVVALNLGNANEVAAMTTLADFPEVLWSSPNFQYDNVIAPEFIPDDPYYDTQYHHALMGSEAAWDVTMGDPSIVLALPDDGLMLDHEDAPANIFVNAGEVPDNGIDDDGNGYVDDVSGWNFVDSTNDVVPFGRHGTFLAGVASAATNNNAGIAGIAANTTLMPLKFFDPSRPFLWDSTTVAETYTYATDNGAHIVSTSYYIDGFVGDPIYTAALQYSYDAGVLHFNSAGNSGIANPPRQAFTQTLLVANTNSADVLNDNSNYGSGIDISASGTSIRSLNTDGQYRISSGTSIAAPNAAGAAALIWSANPTWTRDMVAAQLLATADSIDVANPDRFGELGSGRVNVEAALSQTLTAPTIQSVSGLPVDGSILTAAPDSTFQFRFDQILDSQSANELGNYDLRAAGSDGIFDTGDDIVVTLELEQPYQIGANEISVQIVDALGPGNYRVSLPSDGVRNPFGISLDGDFDGIEGGSYKTYFTIADTVPTEPIPFGPLGGLTYRATFDGSVSTTNQSQVFALPLGLETNFSAKVSGVSTLVPMIQVLDADGTIIHESISHANVALAQTIPSVDGNLFLRVAGHDQTTGEYTLDLAFNAAIEKEFDLSTNDSLATAQGVDLSSLQLGDQSKRMAVIGSQTGADEDWFSFHLADGQSFSAVLDANAGAKLELYDEAGIFVANSSPVLNRPGAIHSFLDITIDESSNQYFARVTGVDGEYVLLATAGADLDADMASQSGDQRLTDSRVLGYVDSSIHWSANASTFVVGDVLDAAFSDVTLSTTNGGSVFSQVTMSGANTFSANADFAAGWSANNLLRADFTTPVSFVSIDVGSNDLSDQSILRAYDTSGNLIESLTGLELANDWQTLTISRQLPDISFVTVGGLSTDITLADNLRYGTTITANQNSGSTSGAIGLGGADTYLIAANIDDTIEIEVATLEVTPTNISAELSPNDIQLQLRAPSGVIVASGTQSLSHSTTEVGDFELMVSIHPDAGEMGGAHMLSVDGATLASDGPLIFTTDLSKAHRTTYPTTVLVNTDRSVRPGTIDPAEVKIGGVPASGYQQIDATTIEFTIDPASNTGVGIYQLEILDGAFTDLGLRANKAYVTEFAFEDTEAFTATGFAGSLASRSVTNREISTDGGSVNFTFLIEAGETVMAMATAGSSNSTLSILANDGDAILGEIGEPVVLPIQSADTSGPFTISVSSDLADQVDLEIVRNSHISHGDDTPMSLPRLIEVGDRTASSYSAIGSLNGDGITLDVQEFDVDLTGQVGTLVDVGVFGLNDMLSNVTLEIIAPDGSIEITGGTRGAGFASILDHQTLQDGIYKIRIESDQSAEYQLMVTTNAILDLQAATGAIRTLDGQLGAIGSVGDTPDTFLLNVENGVTYSLRTENPHAQAFHVTPNPVDLELSVVDDHGNVLAEDQNSIGDGNAEIIWTAPFDGPIKVIIGSESTEGEYVLTVEHSTTLPDGDFDDDGDYDCHDINALTFEIATGTHHQTYDLNVDGVVDGLDLDAWLLEAALNHGYLGPYLSADANLDGSVDASDFNVWNDNKYTAQSNWCSGDFNADGFVDGSDFNIWNSSKYTATERESPVASAFLIPKAVDGYAPMKNSEVDLYFSMPSTDEPNSDKYQRSPKNTYPGDFD